MKYILSLMLMCLATSAFAKHLPKPVDAAPKAEVTAPKPEPSKPDLPKPAPAPPLRACLTEEEINAVMNLARAEGYRNRVNEDVEATGHLANSALLFARRQLHPEADPAKPQK